MFSENKRQAYQNYR